jgi:hypothetical protein
LLRSQIETHSRIRRIVIKSDFESETSYLIYHEIAELLKKTSIIEEIDFECSNILKPQQEELMKALKKNKSLKK